MHSALTCAYLAVKELSDGMESVGDLTNEQVDDLMKEATKIEEKAVAETKFIKTIKVIYLW